MAMAPRHPVGLTPRGGGIWGIVASGKIELLVVTTEKSVPKTHWQRYLKNLATGEVATSRKHFWMGGSEQAALSEKKVCSVAPKCVYIFNRRRAKKEIPV